MSIKRDFQELVSVLSNNPEYLNNEELANEALGVIKERLRRKCKKSLYFLCKYVLQFNDLSPMFHKPLCMLIQAVNPWVVKVVNKEIKSVPLLVRNRLWLVFRGSFKTTIITIGHSVQLIINSPNIRILLASNKLDNAKEILGVIKNQFMYNDIFRFLFPECCPQASKDGKIEWGTSVAVTVPNRTNLVIKEATIECAGVDTGLTSRHYDYMKKDDLVTQKSVTTEDQIQASIDWDRMSLSLFEVPERGFTDWIGTRYDYRDLYGHLLKRDPRTLYTHLQTDMDEDGKPVFPERFSLEGLDQIKQDQGSVIYSSQYKLNPISPEDQLFKDEWINRCEYIDSPTEYAIVINVDPAAKRRKNSKFTSMLVHKVDKSGRWYLVDGVFDKLSPTERILALFTLVSKWYKHLRFVTYETIGFQDTDKVFIEKMMLKKRMPFHIEPVESQSVSKEDRISGLAPLYEHQFIMFPHSLPYYSRYENRVIDIVASLKYELARFPQCEHLDLLDSQAQMLIKKVKRVRPFKISEPKKVAQPGSFNWYRAKMKAYNRNPLRQFYGIEEVWDKLVTV